LKIISSSSSGHHEEDSFSQASLGPRYNLVSSPTPGHRDVHKNDHLSISKYASLYSDCDKIYFLCRDVRDSRLSPTYDSRSRNISGDLHYRETVEKSMQTSQNLMSVVTGSLTPSLPKTRPASQASKPSSKKNEPTKEVQFAGSHEPPCDVSAQAARKKQAELERSSVAGAVEDIMIKEVAADS
jgi:hypothetical protein